MKFNKGRCKVLRAQYRLGCAQLRSTLGEKDLKGYGEQPAKYETEFIAEAMIVNQILGCICTGITSKDRNVIILLYSVLVRSHSEHCMQFSSPNANNVQTDWSGSKERSQRAGEIAL